LLKVLINGFIKDLTSSKLRIVMINVCLCGTCLLWPFALLFHVTRIESIDSEQLHSYITIITFISALCKKKKIFSESNNYFIFVKYLMF
jgi:hypothetical protein